MPPSNRFIRLYIRKLDDIDICTLGESARYFSYRGARRAGAADYGRNLSAIALL